ncbi:MAG: PD40 domain-containing protein [Dehalococcoidia bacterium]|nr:PD40 domain-containing protein [Dehalococcoidia bacterium]
MKRWVIVGVVVAVLVLLVGAVMYVSLWRTLSKPDVVKSIEQVPGASDVSDASWSPDGLTILYASYPGIWRIDSDGENRICLCKGNHPTWSPDGLQIAFASDNGLEVINADGGGRQLLVELAEVVPSLSEHESVESTAWSPDGSMIAFDVWAFIPDPSDMTGQTGDSFTRIWIVDADSGNLKRLTTDSANERILSWSPDGQGVVFVSDRDEDKGYVWTLHVDDNGPPQLTEGGRASPDGTRIAYVTEDADLWLKDADGGNSVRVAGGSGWYENPIWSPDGTMLAFDSTIVGPVGNIWIVNADGTGKTRLTGATKDLFDCTPEWIDYREPQWSPDGTKLLFLNGLTKGNTSWGNDRLWVLELNLENGLA